jgi:hypothetical protein
MPALFHSLKFLPVWFCLALIAPLAHATDPMPALLPLQSGDIPAGCGCSFGENKGVPLIFWSWENDKHNAVIREPGGLRKLTLREEKYFPAQPSPKPGDRMALQLASANWSIQTANEVSRACSPKAKHCNGTDYRTRIILQWQGSQRDEVPGWGHCGCN